MTISLQSVYVSRIMEGGPAEKDGKLKIGDHVISVSQNLHFMGLHPL